MKFADLLAVRLLAWLLLWRQLSVVLLVAAVVVSSLGVVYTAHETRQAYAQLQDLQENRDSLDNEYEKLLLEQGAWANYSRVDRVSHDQLKMTSPKPEDIVVVSR
ncbi:MAG TPA: cell division protein FtsL [Pseudomonadales bacterium]|nr:cell division protein FtsL [Pseudomonadales bacterium]